MHREHRGRLRRERSRPLNGWIEPSMCAGRSMLRPYKIKGRKLVPWGIAAPKFAATVWPMSASVERMPRFAPSFAKATEGRPSAPGAAAPGVAAAPGGRAPCARHGGAIREDRNVLARMIRRGIHGIGIAAVIGGDQQQIARAHGVQKRAEQRVEFLERTREAFHVLAMAVEHVEIHEIREDQPLRPARERFGELGHAVGVVFRGDVIRDAAAIVDIVNFADAEDGNFAVGEHVEQHRARRLDGVIVAAFGAAKISRRAR